MVSKFEIRMSNYVGSRREGLRGKTLTEAFRTLGLYAQDEEKDLKTSSMYDMRSMKYGRAAQ